ncbi:MAG: LLM class flavin-dependent oxidoreductase [Candidatus Caldarchaeum sp.]
MVKVSVVVEGDKPFSALLEVAKTVDEYAFYSLQVYEHLPYRPAWGICFSVAPFLRRVLVGPVTVPANLYSPHVNARFAAYLASVSPGAVLGISRGAYMGERRATIKEVVEHVEQVVAHMARMDWALGKPPVIYVGTSGPLLTRAAAKSSVVDGVVVDNLANPIYAAMMRKWMDEAGGAGKELVARPFTFLSEKQNEQRQFLNVLLRYVVDLVDGSPMMEYAGLRLEDLSDVDDEVAACVLDNFSIHGDVDDVVEKSVKLLKNGVNHLVFGHPIAANIVDGCRKIGEKVVPVLRDEFG